MILVARDNHYERWNARGSALRRVVSVPAIRQSRPLATAVRRASVILATIGVACAGVFAQLVRSA
jgi:hypothetical protein